MPELDRTELLLINNDRRTDDAGNEYTVGYSGFGYQVTTFMLKKVAEKDGKLVLQRCEYIQPTQIAVVSD